jgi:4-hydroxy-tetrahydrodipicolinate reductase
MPDMRLVIAGAGGRMGRALARAILETPGFALAGAFERANAPGFGEDVGTLAGLPPCGISVTGDPTPLVANADGIVDFTAPAASVALAAIAAQARIVHVLGTTGLTHVDDNKIEAAARNAVIIRSGNMSLGVNLLAALTKRVAKTLGADFDIEIVEMHHNKKVDAPSGTALMLGRAAAEGLGVDLTKHSVRARDGEVGERKRGQIGFAALRGGTVIGDHSVVFAGPYERIELKHVAEDRMLFARGALVAARWGRGKKPGIYSMADVLGLTDF